MHLILSQDIWWNTADPPTLISSPSETFVLIVVTSKCVGIFILKKRGWGEMPQNLEGCTLNILMSQTEKTWYTEREKGTTEKKVLWCQRYTCTNTPTTDSF